MRGGDLEAALVAVLADGEVEHLGADLAEQHDVGARVARRRWPAASASSGDDSRMSRPIAIALRLEGCDVRAADAIRAVGVELVGHDAPDVVGLEHGGGEHRARVIEQVELRPVRVADAADMAALLVAQRELPRPVRPASRPEEFYTVEGQRRELEQLELAALAGTRQRFLIQRRRRAWSAGCP